MRMKMTIVLEYDAPHWPAAGETGGQLLEIVRATGPFIGNGIVTGSEIVRADGLAPDLAHRFRAEEGKG